MTTWTPYPVGQMPATVHHLPNDPHQRLELDVAEGLTLHDLPAVVTDRHTGERFELTRAACGGGCECAAEARWIPAARGDAAPGQWVDGDVIAEDAPIGVQLWPTVAPEYAPNFTLARVEVVRDVNGTRVRWEYESGSVRWFRPGEQVACRTYVAEVTA